MGFGSCTGALVALLAGLSAAPRAQSQEPQRVGGVTEGVTAVLVDVVVRDRRGNPVRDLRAADFEILEDNVGQKIGSFSIVADGMNNAVAGKASAAPGAELPADPTPAGGGGRAIGATGPAVTALVFHGLSPEARRRAVQAAQSYLGEKEEMTNYVGIFGIDLSLTPYVPFTRNGVAVRQALARLATGSAPGLNSPEQQQQRAAADAQAASASATAAAAITTGGAGTAAAVGSSAGAAQLAQMQSQMVQAFERMDRDQSGYITTDALFAIVRTLGRLPGRKSVVLFSEGISIPAAVHRLFLGVIDAANRSNVSIYTMDAAGLRAESDQGRIRDLVNGAATVGIDSGFADVSGDRPLSERLEVNEYNLRSDPHYGLGTLAQDTGGVLFSGTNNLRTAFDRIESDLRNYYLIGYTPLNAKYDGRFRTIQVRVKRPNVTVAARRGYFAVRNPGTMPVNEWEAPALAALEQKPVPNAFPVRAGALLFPERGRPGLVPVVVDLKTAPITFQPAADGKTYTSDFTVLVRFLDDRNQMARKVSQHYEINGPIAEMERAKQGQVIFYRESELPPGVYNMETVVHDAASGKSSVRFSTVEVPKEPDAALRMSSLMLVKRGESVAEKDRPADSPLLVNNVILSPNLGDAVSRASKEVAFYFAVYPAPKGPAPDSLIQLFDESGQRVAQLPMPVGEADKAGRVQQLGRLPIDQLAPGAYELRAVVKQGSAQVVRSTTLRIVE